VTLDPDGRPFIALAAVPAAIAAVKRRPLLALALGVLPVAIGAFFRDPDRPTDSKPHDDLDVVIAPADAKVMYAGPGEDGVAPPGEWQQVTMFLSVLDVHINRSPYGGRITSVTYRPGRFRTAFSQESGVENERSELTIVAEVDGEERTVIFRQVVGILARRVVTRVAPGDVVRAGDRIGLMKFGSRMDVFVPPGVELLVRKGDKTVAGVTPIARWPRRGATS
jgi:phosphatidylserine decarboxylase